MRPYLIHKINYVDFPGAITDKYGVIPVDYPSNIRFCSPASLGRADLSIVLAAYESGQTYFRRLSDEELEQWRASRAVITNATTPPADQPPVPPSSSTNSAQSNSQVPQQQEPTEPNIPAPDPAHASSSSAILPQPAFVINFTDPNAPPSTGVFSVNSGAVVEKPMRRKRKDAGTKRGPNARTRNKLNAANSEVQTSGGTTPAPLPAL